LLKASAACNKKISLAPFDLSHRILIWKILTTTAATETSPVGTRSITTTTERHFVVLLVIIGLYKAGDFRGGNLQAVKFGR
jgi:hypothetical protein